MYYASAKTFQKTVSLHTEHERTGLTTIMYSVARQRQAHKKVSPVCVCVCVRREKSSSSFRQSTEIDIQEGSACQHALCAPTKEADL